MCIGKFIFRTALIGGLAAGGLALLAPAHFQAGLAQVRGGVQNAMDACIDDPVAIRRQLQSLAEELPGKIGELRSEIAEVEAQIAQMTRDSEVSRRVIAATTSDLNDLDALIARATATEQSAGGIVQVRFGGNRMDIDSAKQEFHRVNKIRVSYEDRLAANERDLGYLGTQRERLVELLDNLETEYATIETQMWQIDRKIDAIARSERLADTIEDRQATFADLGSFDASSLEQIQAKLRKWEIETTARLEALDNTFKMKNYEKEAATDLDYEQRERLESGDNDADHGADEGDSVVLGPTIIE